MSCIRKRKRNRCFRSKPLLCDQPAPLVSKIFRERRPTSNQEDKATNQKPHNQRNKTKATRGISMTTNMTTYVMRDGAIGEERFAPQLLHRQSRFWNFSKGGAIGEGFAMYILDT
eukprot:3540651-Amphidinium_carterae.1